MTLPLWHLSDCTCSVVPDFRGLCFLCETLLCSVAQVGTAGDGSVQSLCLPQSLSDSRRSTSATDCLVARVRVLQFEFDEQHRWFIEPAVHRIEVATVRRIHNFSCNNSLSTPFLSQAVGIVKRAKMCAFHWRRAWLLD